MQISQESDEMLHKITGSIFTSYTVLAAHKIGLFTLLSQKPLSIEQIAERLSLERRAAQALISASSAFDLIKCEENKYSLSSIGKQYLNKESPCYFGDVLELYLQEGNQPSLLKIEEAVRTNQPQVYSGGHLFNVHKERERGKRFTNSMHSKSYAPAYSWPKHLPMKNEDVMLDIGAGSGIHSIAACQHYPIRAVVCDLPEILSFTQEKILESGLENKISCCHLDMWKDSFPQATIHFYSDIFHDWSPEKCFFLAQKSYDSLPQNGRIILNEMLFNDDKTGPELTAAYNIKMLYWTEGQQFSRKEISLLLEEAGFRKIQIINYFGSWSLVIGEKSK